MKKATKVAPKEEKSFSTVGLLTVLKSAYLDGAVEEFVLNVQGGVATISAVDKSAVVFVCVSGPVGNVPDCQLGLKEPGFLIKLLESIKEEKVSFVIEEDKWLKIDTGSGNVKVLLSQPEMIPTSVQEYKGPVEKMREEVEYSIALEKEVVEKYVYFQNLVQNNTTGIYISKGKLSFGSGKFETRTFIVDVGEIESKEDFELVVFGKYLKAIFSELDFSRNVEMSFGPGSPILIETGDFFWSLSPALGEGA